MQTAPRVDWFSAFHLLADMAFVTYTMEVRLGGLPPRSPLGFLLKKIFPRIPFRSIGILASTPFALYSHPLMFMVRYALH